MACKPTAAAVNQGMPFFSLEGLFCLLHTGLCCGGAGLPAICCSVWGLFCLVNIVCLASAALFIYVQVRPSLRVPRRHELRMLNSTAGPATILYACKNICYLM